VPRKTTEPSPNTGPQRVDETLTYRLHRLHRFSDRDSARAYQDELGMSMSDGRCLGAIGTFGALSIKNLADKANLDKAQASRSAQSLVDQKLVVKTGSLEDGRGVVLDLTPAGKVQWRRAMDMINRRNQQIFGKLSPLEQLALAEILDRLITAYES
jgi:DNA-binding MarR family transcriptional regulator